MEQIKKSLAALERAMAKLGKQRVSELVKEVKSLNIKGPTFQQYFSEFETYFRSLYDIRPEHIKNRHVVIEAVYKENRETTLTCQVILNNQSDKKETTANNAVVSFLYLCHEPSHESQICLN
jgi:ribosomal protein L16 Arg81 hydroxylase